MYISVRKGDIAILIGAAAIAAYEKTVADDEDLVSRRVASYKATHPLLTYGIVLITAAHVLELLPEQVDVYHHLMRFMRPKRPPTC